MSDVTIDDDGSQTTPVESAPVESPMEWFVIQAYSGFEKHVQESLREYIRREGMEDHFGDIEVPTEQVVDLTLKKLGREATCETQCTPVYGGDMARLKTYVERAQKRHKHLAPDVVENLVNFYGSRIDEVLATADERQGEREALLKRLAPENPTIGALAITSQIANYP